MTAAGLPVLLGHGDGAACGANPQAGGNAASCQAAVLQAGN